MLGQSEGLLDRRSWNEPKRGPRLSTVSILLVEDDPADTSLILSVLKRHPDVSAAHAGDSPFLVLHELETGVLRPNLVLLDVHMPLMDGFEFLAAFRRIPEMAEVPVVFLTTSPLAKNVGGPKRGAPLTYVVKPDTFAELQTRLDAVIRRVIASR
jgi:DNA-binding response OmpR family regulator